MIRIHDRYVLKAFWSAFGAVLLFFTVLTVVLDLSDRISRVSRNWGAISEYGYKPAQLLFEYYITLIPVFWLRLIPICGPVAALFSLSRLNRFNELVPLVTSGVSMRRITVPIALSAVLLTVIMLVFREDVVPRISRAQMRVDRILSRSTPDRIENVPHFHDAGGARMSADSFHPLGRKLESVWLTFRDGEGRNTESFWYPELQWQAAQGHWVAPRGGQHHVPIAGGEGGTRRTQIEPGHTAPLEARLLLIEITTMQSETSQLLSFTESRELLDANPDNPRFVVLHHAMWTLPISCVVLMLLTLPLCVRVGRRSGIMESLLVGMALFAAFYVADFTLGGIAGGGDLNPVAAAWLPTVLFGSLGLALYLDMDR